MNKYISSPQRVIYNVIPHASKREVELLFGRRGDAAVGRGVLVDILGGDAEIKIESDCRKMMVIYARA